MSRKFACIALLLFIAVPILADDDDNDRGHRRMVIVRDGKVLLDEDEPFGGKRAFIGVSMNELTPELREFFGAPKDSGSLVASLTENGPAAKAGVRVGDVITSVNGQPVDNAWDVSRAMKGNKAGDSVRIEVIRNKARQTLTVIADEREGLLPMKRALDLGQLLERNGGEPLTNGEWHMRIPNPRENEELRARIHELETRLLELEKKLKK